MLDFKLLNDPEYQRRVRESREQREAELEEHANRMREAITLLGTPEIEERLAANERSFVRSCRSRISCYLPLTDAQERWLLDLSKKHGGQGLSGQVDTSDLTKPSDPPAKRRFFRS